MIMYLYHWQIICEYNSLSWYINTSRLSLISLTFWWSCCLSESSMADHPIDPLILWNFEKFSESKHGTINGNPSHWVSQRCHVFDPFLRQWWQTLPASAPCQAAIYDLARGPVRFCRLGGVLSALSAGATRAFAPWNCTSIASTICTSSKLWNEMVLIPCLKK